MKRQRYTKKTDRRNLPASVLVFTEDEKKVYFHHGNVEVPDFLDKKTFYANYAASK